MASKISREYLALFGIAILLVCAPLAKMVAQNSSRSDTKDWEKVCERATAEPFVEPALAGPATEAELKNCDSAALYYGFGGAPDPLGALQCGYYQRTHPNPNVADPFAGPGVLTMLYANGKGVAGDYDLAIRFACENPWAAGAEMEYRIRHLQHLRDTNSADSSFDLCDDATSGLMGGACESIRQRFADARRAKELEAISSQWPAEVKQALQSLQKAEHEFEDARAANEIDLTGSARGAFFLSEQGRLRDQFLINLKRFAKGDVPRASAATASDTDRWLNAVYQQIQQFPEDRWQFGTIKRTGIRDTERAWLKLRDAWIDFGRLAYPTLDTNRIAPTHPTETPPAGVPASAEVGFESIADRVRTPL